MTLDRKDYGRRDTCAFHQSDFFTPLCEVGQPLCKALYPPGCYLGNPLNRLALPGTSQATLGFDVVLVPSGVPRPLVPLDGALVLQILDGIVVVEAVGVDPGAASSSFTGQGGSWAGPPPSGALGG